MRLKEQLKKLANFKKSTKLKYKEEKKAFQSKFVESEKKKEKIKIDLGGTQLLHVPRSLLTKVF